MKRNKVAVLIEGDFYEPEIEFYLTCFTPVHLEVHFLTRLWGQSHLTFFGHEERKPFICRESFETIDDAALSSYAAVIVPAGIVADRLRYTEDIEKLPPACVFLQRVFADKAMIKGIICHGAWLCAPVPELVRGRRMVVHNNLLGDAKLMGIRYVNEDVVVDGDLVSARTGGDHVEFVAAILRQIKDLHAREDEKA